MTWFEVGFLLNCVAILGADWPNYALPPHPMLRLRNSTTKAKERAEGQICTQALLRDMPPNYEELCLFLDWRWPALWLFDLGPHWHCLPFPLSWKDLLWRWCRPTNWRRPRPQFGQSCEDLHFLHMGRFWPARCRPSRSELLQ